MVASNLILAVLALTIPSAFAAPIPAAKSNSLSKNGAEAAVDATSQAITQSVPANPAAVEANPDNEAAPKSKSKTTVGNKKNKSHKNKGNKKHKHKNLKSKLQKAHKGLNKHKNKANKGHKSHKLSKAHKALKSQKSQSADDSTQSQTTQTLVRRATPAQVGAQIKLGSVTFKLDAAVSGASGRSSNTAVFRTTYAGQPAFAKQNIRDSKFAAEQANTKKASDALRTGLYLASGKAADGSDWLVTKAQPGKSFGILVHEGKFKDKKTAVDKAVAAVVRDQQTLATAAHIMQGDDNTENWLFSDDLSKVYPIDMGITAAAPAGWNNQIAASQKKNWEHNFDMAYDMFKTGSASKSKSSSKKSPRSI